MNCRDIEKLIALHAEGDLPAGEGERVLKHLETCANCRTLLAELTSSQTALRQLRDEAVDETATAAWRRGLMSRVETESPKRRFAWGLAFAAAAAGIAVAVIAVNQMASRRAPPAPPVPSIARVMTPPAVGAGLHPQAPIPSRDQRERFYENEVQPSRNRQGAVLRKPSAQRSRDRQGAVVEPKVRQPQPAPDTQPLLVKFETSDPDVIIYWTIERRGG
jgi:hypothetical protein